jgi:uncharacterized protein (TIRG00374 family)
VSVDPVAKAAIAIAGRLPVLRRFAHRFDEAHAHTAILLAPVPLVAATALASVSWFFECLAFYVVVRGFPGAHIDVLTATAFYAATTVAGALSFLPGGLGVTEAGMLALLKRAGIELGTAAAATFVTRAATLWFAVALGLPALLLYARRKHVDIDADVARPDAANGLP